MRRPGIEPGLPPTVVDKGRSTTELPTLWFANNQIAICTYDWLPHSFLFSDYWAAFILVDNYFSIHTFKLFLFKDNYFIRIELFALPQIIIEKYFLFTHYI